MSPAQVRVPRWLLPPWLTCPPGLQAFGDRASKERLFEFDEWLEALEATHGADEERLQQLRHSLTETEELLSNVDAVRNDFLQLQLLYHQSYQKTADLHRLTESVRQEQYSLLVAREKISEAMSHFDELEKMEKQFANPSHLILNESLVGKLSRLDECIAFMRSRASYQESQEYLERFAFLESQVLQTIRNYVTSAIVKTTKQVMPHPSQSLNPDDSVFSLFYIKFQANCHRIKSLVALIEERAAGNPHFLQLLYECHEAYTSARDSLMTPVLATAIEEMTQSHGDDVVALVRNSSRMLMHVCRDEDRLFKQFFSESSRYLEDLQDTLCRQLYNALRPIVIHVSDGDLLTRLCSLVKDEVIDDFVAAHASELKAFRSVMEGLLEDVEERLVYLTT